jgi:hypothetical protein
MVSEGVCDNDRTGKPRAANLSQSYPSAASMASRASEWSAGWESFDRFFLPPPIIY